MFSRDGCELTVGGVPYRIEVHRLHKRFFSHYGGDFHRHPHYHFIYMAGREGQLLMRFGRRVEKAAMPRHSLLFINPDHEHAFAAPAAGVEHVSFHVGLLDAAGRRHAEPLETLFGGPDAEVRPYRLARPTEFEAYEYLRLHRMAETLHEAEDAPPMARSAALFGLFLAAARLVLRGVFSPAEASSRHESIVAAARAIVEGNYHAPDFNVGVLAAQMRFHPNHLNLLFRQATGLPLGEYLIRRRIHHARRLLAEGMSVKETTFLCGYRSQSYFASLFRRRVGCPPRQYHEGAETFAPRDPSPPASAPDRRGRKLRGDA